MSASCGDGVLSPGPPVERLADGRVRALAPAKINLVLEILGRREDGFHDLLTLMTTISVCDELVLEPAAGISLILEPPARDVPSGPDNLVWRAAAAARDALGLPGGARITLRKRVPAQAGLGGGSSDAASTLVAVARLHGSTVPPTDPRLLAAAASLGSDVPFFLWGGCAICRGRGERVTPVAPPRERLHLAVLFAGLPVPTKDAYAALGIARGTRTSRSGDDASLPLRALANGDAVALASAMRNDLEPAAFALQPGILEARDRLLRAGAARALLCGSGGAVLGLWDRPPPAIPTQSDGGATPHEWLRPCRAPLSPEDDRSPLPRIH